MANRLPTVGGDTGNWGTLLNAFLSTEHNPLDGTHGLPISQLNSGAPAQTNDIIPIVRGTTSFKVNVGNIAALSLPISGGTLTGIANMTKGLSVGTGGGSAGDTIVRVKTNSNVADFGLYAANAVFTGITDDILYLGYNIDGVANQPILMHSLEADYNDVAVGHHWAEWNFEYTIPSHGTTYRPMAFGIKRDDGSKWNWQFRIGQNNSLFTIQDYLGNNTFFSVDQTGAAILSNSLAVGVNRLFVDFTNQRVGIGTATPAYILDIISNNPTVNIATNYIGNEPTLQFTGLTNVGAAAIGSIVNSWSGGGMLFILPRDVDGHGYHFKSHASAELMYINSSNGMVGIGTVSPKSKLHVVGLASYADNATAVSAGLTAGAFYYTGDVVKVVHA